jgi:hypothetical protein
VIVGDLYVLGTVAIGSPFETDAPLVVDANAVLAFPIALESLQRVARQRSEVEQAHGCFQGPQALFRLAAKALELWHPEPLGETLRALVAVAPDHRRR